MEPINELTRHTLHVDCTKENGQAEVPTTITWRIDAITGAQSTEVQGNTDYTPASAAFDLVIPAELNRMTIAGADVENRLVTVIAPGLAAAQYTYRIKRLEGLA